MNTKVICRLILFGFWFARALAQTPEALVAEGRARIVSGDYVKAEERFAAAQLLSPTHEPAHVLRAVTRLLALPQRPAVRAMLDQLGVSPTNRDARSWTAGIPSDTNGVVLVPLGMSAESVMQSWRTNVVPMLLAAATDLGRVTNSAFLLPLTAAETTSVDVTLDLADVKMLRAICLGTAYLSLTLREWNWEVPLTALRQIATGPKTTAAEFLGAYPQLLEFSSSADLDLGRSTFDGFAESYLAASEGIRARPLSAERLFNWDDRQVEQEAQFREVTEALRQSLSGPVRVPGMKQGTVNLGAQFTSGFSLRDWLPEIAGNKMVIGSLPDPTFGGVLAGFSRGEIEDFLLNSNPGRDLKLQGVPGLETPEIRGETVRIALSSVRGVSYELEGSEDLLRWSALATGVAQGETLLFEVPKRANGFFRIRELTKPINDDYSGRIRLTGASPEFVGSFQGSTREFREPTAHFGPYTLWWEWVASEAGVLVVEDLSGDYSSMALYLADPFSGLLPVWEGSGNTRLAGSVFRGDTILIGAGSWSEDSQIHLRLGLRPFPANDRPEQAQVLAGESVLVEGSLAGAGPEGSLTHGGSIGLDTVWYRWTAPANGRYLVSLLPSGSEANGLWRVGLDAYRRTGTTLSAPLAGSGGQGVQFEATSGEGFDFAVFQRWAAGEDFRIQVRRVVSPANDPFAAAALLTGDSPVFEGTLEGSTREVGGPEGSGSMPGGSVWFRWVAPRDGVVDVQVNPGEGSVGLMAFTGSSLLNLVPQASVSEGVGALVRFRAVMGETYQLRVDQTGYPGVEYKLAIQLRNGPANDEYDERTPVLVAHGPLDGDLREATYRASEPGPAGPSIWWGWTAPASGVLRLRVDRADFRSSLIVFSALDLTIVGSNEGTSPSLELPVVGGKEYAIRVSGVGGQWGRFVLRFDYFTKPANDDFGTRQVLSGLEVHARGENALATFETGESYLLVPASRKSVWWSWTAPVTGVVRLDTIGSNFDTLLGVLQGETLAGLSRIADDDESGGAHTSRLEFKATAGMTYQIVVDGFGGETGVIALNLQATDEPRILASPQSQFFLVGSALTLTVDAWGAPPLTYQWSKDGVQMPGVSGPSYSVAVAGLSDSGVYSVKVSNPKGEVTSSAARVVVGEATRVGVFDDPAYVDTVGGIGSESDTVQASLRSFGGGVVVSTIAEMNATIETNGVLVFPELELGDLSAAISEANRNRLKGFVERGGVLIVHGSFNGWAAKLINVIFGFNLAELAPSGGALPLQLGPLSAGSPFQAGPVSLPLNNGSMLLRTTSLPSDAQSIYRTGSGTGVAVIPVGQGSVVYLGWDWWNAAPLGGQDGGWLNVLHRSLLLRQ